MKGFYFKIAFLTQVNRFVDRVKKYNLKVCEVEKLIELLTLN